ncbi:hypothetical protein L5515_017961 [Caenorhabditis briggsae]|uniref:Neurotransmitter-gated ion-channel transmembrane domain-containing protein n=1 Tax=Caenorhabditis briggsae TaxID=6238 RepID=A0AAE9FI69_CAEBR|nr:hypothetical protein L5515_017961 [Caenorhabditis briggsae]
MQSYVPTTLIVVISWFSFWLDVEAVPARVSLAITTLLTLSTQANAARMALPEVSYMKAIDVWMGACMMFVFGVMIEFTIVNYAQRQVMASSMEFVKNGNGTEKKPSRGDLGAQTKQIFRKFRNNDRQHLVEAAPITQQRNGDAEAQEEVWAEQKETNLSEVWKERDGTGGVDRGAERLAHCNEKENDASSPLMGNGRAHVRYGAAESLRSRKTNESSRKKDKWSSAIKQIQKQKFVDYLPFPLLLKLI